MSKKGQLERKCALYCTARELHLLRTIVTSSRSKDAENLSTKQKSEVGGRGFKILSMTMSASFAITCCSWCTVGLACRQREVPDWHRQKPQSCSSIYFSTCSSTFRCWWRPRRQWGEAAVRLHCYHRPSLSPPATDTSVPQNPGFCLQGCKYSSG